MLIRIVRMTFQPDKVSDFLYLFEQSKAKIRNFPGCMHLELLQDAENPSIFCTYSQWTNTEALEEYRHSSFFKNTWAQTKVLFAQKPQAFSSFRVTNVTGV